MEKGGVEWEADLLGAFHRLSRQTKIDPANPDAISEAWSKEHADFHAALVAASASPTLLSIRARLFEQAERYVALSIMSSGPLRDDVTEHKNLMRAALNREVDKAVELNRVHIMRTLDKVAVSLAAGAPADTPAIAESRRNERPGSRKGRTVPAADLREFVARLFAAAGVPAAAAASVAHGLVEADLEGLPSHGVMLADMYIERLRQGSVSRATAATIVSDRQGAVVLDAGHALGQLTGTQAMALAIDKARAICRRDRFGPSWLSFRRRGALRFAGGRSRVRRHRLMQHASLDASAGRRRTRRRQQSNRHRAADGR